MKNLTAKKILVMPLMNPCESRKSKTCLQTIIFNFASTLEGFWQAYKHLSFSSSSSLNIRGLMASLSRAFYFIHCIMRNSCHFYYNHFCVESINLIIFTMILFA